DETLIVVTADHETGSLNLGTGKYALNLKALSNQKVSQDEMSRIFNTIRRNNNGEISWEMARQALADNFGFWTALELTEKQENRLKEAYEKSFGAESNMVKSEYKSNYPLSDAAKRVINEIAMVGWGSGAHSATFIPVFAVGAGAESFSSRSDNALIPRKIAAAGGFPIND
ncbi:MAG: alkaline phosphatase, partial [Paramuribaculum sp.]